MECVTDSIDFNALMENQVIVDNCSVEMVSSKIIFQGKGNVVCFCGDAGSGHLQIMKSVIECKGDNNLIVIRSSKYPLRCKLFAGYGCTIYLGRDFWATTSVIIAANECASVHFGDDALLAREIFVRTSDMHMIYDIASQRRINPNRSVYVGEHVWIGQNTGIMKGAVIGSGSIIGWGSLVGGGTGRVKSIYVGRPASLTREGITWRHKGSNSITEEQVSKCVYDTLRDRKFIYTQEEMDERKAEWEFGLAQAENVEERLAFVLDYSRPDAPGAPGQV